MRTNAQRSDSAQAALTAFIRTDQPAYADEDADTQISDLLCNLHHLADRLGVDWRAVQRRGDGHYREEKREE